MQDTAKLSPLAGAEIDLLISDGVRVTPEDIVRINALAWNIASPETRLALARGIPVTACGVVFRPLPMYAYEWYERVGCDIDDEKEQENALAYAMAYGYSTGNHLELVGKDARRAVKSFVRQFRGRRAEMIEAVAQVTQQDKEEPLPPDPNAKPMGLGDLSAVLSAMTGLPPEEFERRMSLNHALRILHYTLQKQAQAAGVSAPDDAHMRAEAAMGLYLHEVRERHRKEQEATNE